MKRQVLINCDDLGYHPSINQAVVEILSRKHIVSTSIMAVGPYFDDAVERLRVIKHTVVGVHLTLSSEYPYLRFGPLSNAPSLVDGKGHFHPDIRPVRESIRPDEVAKEFELQIKKVQQAGLSISHLDGHMFCFEADVGGPQLEQIVKELSNRYSIPYRTRTCSHLKKNIPYNMIWDGYDTENERYGYYRSYLQEPRLAIEELIIHPGKDLTAMTKFSAVASRRYYDYCFFLSEEFETLVREHQLSIVGW